MLEYVKTCKLGAGSVNEIWIPLPCRASCSLFPLDVAHEAKSCPILSAVYSSMNTLPAVSLILTSSPSLLCLLSVNGIPQTVTAGP